MVSAVVRKCVKGYKRSEKRNYSGWKIRIINNGVIMDFYVGSRRFGNYYDCLDLLSNRVNTLSLKKLYLDGHLFCGSDNVNYFYMSMEYNRMLTNRIN